MTNDRQHYFRIEDTALLSSSTTPKNYRIKSTTFGMKERFTISTYQSEQQLEYIVVTRLTTSEKLLMLNSHVG